MPLDELADGGAPPLDAEEVGPLQPVPIARYVIIGTACAAAFVALSVAVDSTTPFVDVLDQRLHDFALSHRGEADLAFARFVTWGGATAITLPALIVIGALGAPKRLALQARIGSGVLLAGVASLGVYAGLAINRVIDRGRPPLLDWAGDAGGPAFPSGHTTAATLFAAAAAWVLATRSTSDQGTRLVIVAAIVWAVVVGWSRYWLGVHWPIDVVGGWLFGTAWATLAIAGLAALSQRSGQGQHRDVLTQPTGSTSGIGGDTS